MLEKKASRRRVVLSGLAALAAARTASAFGDVGALVNALEHPETLDIQVNGDAAEVQLPSGHRVLLKREAGVWRVLDFD